MPELPELEVYCKRLRSYLVGRRIDELHVAQPFVLRTVDPPINSLVGAAVTDVDRLGKRIAIGFDSDSRGLYLLIHMMRSGRLHWVRDKRLHKSQGSFALRAGDGWELQMTETSRRKQASIHLHARRDLDHGDLAVSGLDPLSDAFTVGGLTRILHHRNRQLKGALIDQRCVAGIGNAFSDEILFDARLSPLKLTQKLTDGELQTLHASIRSVLAAWIQRIDDATPDRMPTDQKTWRKHFAVHGQYKKPCARCGRGVARISFAESELNYCPNCQTGGKLLADRRLSKLMRR